MSKRWIIWSLALSVAAGSVAGFAVTRITSSINAGRISVAEGYSIVERPSSSQATGTEAATHFTAGTADGGQALLPDFTTAAEGGVESVVFIENVRKVAMRSYGGGGNFGFDPFEFFFGPSQRGGQGGGNGSGQQPEQREPQTREQRSGGSGVIISEDGYIVSNNHVVDKADELTVTLHDGSVHRAELVGTDAATDLALLKIDAKGLRAMPIGNSENLRLGEWVLAIGNPFGLRSTVTAGIVSAKGRTLGVGGGQLGIESFIQTDAAVNSGNGKLVGINTLIQTPTGTYTGYSFAIPSSIMAKVVSDLREFGVVQRAMLGVTYREITPEFAKEKELAQTGGIYVIEAVEEGAAAAAGIKEGDILTQINEKAMQTSADVQETMAQFSPGDKITVGVKREGKVKQFEVTLRNRAGKTDRVDKVNVDVLREFGAVLREATDKQKQELKIKGGLQVAQITDPEGLLARSRVRTGFIITAVNEKAVSRLGDLDRITEPVRSIDGVYPDGRIVSYQVVRE